MFTRDILMMFIALTVVLGYHNIISTVAQCCSTDSVKTYNTGSPVSRDVMAFDWIYMNTYLLYEH